MNPFMTAYKNNFITAARAGGSAYILLCALISVAQNPGSTDMRFSVATYMIIFGCLLSLPILAYKYIMDKNLGLRKNPASGDTEKIFTAVDREKAESLSEVSDPKANMSILEPGVNPLHEERKEMMPAPEIQEGGSSTHTSLIAGSASAGLENPNTSRNRYRSTFKIFGWKLYSGIVNDTVNDFMATISVVLVKDKWHEEMPWLRKTVPYMLTVGWVNFNTWGMVTALLPFAMSNISSNSGSGNLAIAYEVAAVLLVLGYLCVYVCMYVFICIYVCGVIVLYNNDLRRFE